MLRYTTVQYVQGTLLYIMTLGVYVNRREEWIGGHEKSKEKPRMIPKNNEFSIRYRGEGERLISEVHAATSNRHSFLRSWCRTNCPAGNVTESSPRKIVRPVVVHMPRFCKARSFYARGLPLRTNPTKQTIFHHLFRSSPVDSEKCWWFVPRMEWMACWWP
jgi:hypothetical protein